MMFLWLLFLIPLVIFLIDGGGASGSCCVSASHAPVPPTPPAGEDPMAILRRRLARGEITPVEFDEIRRAIG
jgi:uncharacterized membrane protein